MTYSTKKPKEFKADQLAKEVEFKSNELQNFASYIIDKNDFMEKIHKYLKKALKNNNEEAVKEVRTVLLTINNKIILEKEREEFLAHVDHINDTFFIKLSNKFPDLSENDKRLASLLRMGLQSKEIAAILHITPKSVDTNRYRLRKKTKLNQEVNLNDFFRKI